MYAYSARALDHVICRYRNQTSPSQVQLRSSRRVRSTRWLLLRHRWNYILRGYEDAQTGNGVHRTSAISYIPLHPTDVITDVEIHQVWLNDMFYTCVMDCDLWSLPTLCTHITMYCMHSSIYRPWLYACGLCMQSFNNNNFTSTFNGFYLDVETLILHNCRRRFRPRILTG